MSVEIKGDITTIIDTNAKRSEPVIMVWSISGESVETNLIDSALEKVYPKRYKEFRRE